MNSTEIAEVFERAADDVWINGLAKGEYGTRGNARCSTGHLQTHTRVQDTAKYSPPSGRWGECCSQFGRFLLEIGWVGQHFPTAPEDTNLFGVVVYWNDKLCRTAEEVREAFLLAAKDLRNQ